MKLNNKGFAISTVMYMILILAVILILAILSILSARKLILDNIKKEVIANINPDIEITNVICKAVDSTKVGSVKRGVEYKCQVNSKESYNFYVLSTDGDNVNLLMSSNIENDQYFYNPLGEKFPSSDDIYDASQVDKTPSVISQVELLTSSWSYISRNNYSYTDKEAYYTAQLTGYARLPKYSELATLCPCEGTNNTIEGLDGTIVTNPYRYSCESWIIGDYWTMDYAKITDMSQPAWAMNTEYSTLDDFDIVERLYKSGIRPVITIPKTRLEGYDPNNDDDEYNETLTCNSSSSGGSSGGSGGDSGNDDSGEDSCDSSEGWYFILLDDNSGEKVVLVSCPEDIYPTLEAPANDGDYVSIGVVNAENFGGIQINDENCSENNISITSESDNSWGITNNNNDYGNYSCTITFITGNDGVGDFKALTVSFVWQ